MALFTSGTTRRVAAIATVALALSLVIPWAGPAAAHTDGEHDLQITAEVSSNPTGTSHTLTATLGAPALLDGEEIDFEVESGPAVRVGCAPGTDDTCTGGTTSNDGNTPTSPDMTCTIPQGESTCSVVFTSDTAGTNQIRAWVDDDKNNASIDFDVTEGRNAGSSDCPGSDCTGSGAEPGDRTEVDDTDVVEKSWFGPLPANVVLDCSPEVASNPASGTGSSETYTCQLYDNKSTTATADDTVVTQSGVRIDAENLNGANDPDDSSAAGTADFNDACTTDASGSCTVAIAAAESQGGDALLCFWVDSDIDSAFDPDGSDLDGGKCNEADELTGSGSASATEIGTTERDDQTDVVRKTWVARGVATEIDCSPESDQNVRGTSHIVTCVVTDAFGDTVSGAAVDFSVSGRNTAAQNNSLTDNKGEVSFTYNDSNLPLTQEGQADMIEGCIDADTTPGCSTPGTDSGATEDVVSKFWFTTLPEPAAIAIDNDLSDSGGACETGSTRETSATNQVGTSHDLCATVTNSSGQAIPGQSVTFTTSGPGGFWTDSDNDGDVDQGEFSQTTFTTTTDASGRAFATIASTSTGTTTITATSGSVSDTASKTWTTPAAGARNVDCTPDTATNPSGTSHIVTCTVTDRYGNPVPGVTVNGSESGPGRLDSSSAAQTDSSGRVEFVVSSIEGETGDQSISAEIGSPARTGAGANDDPCEQAAGTTTATEPGGAGTDQAGVTAGNCTDTVTKTWGEVPPPEPTVERHARDVRIKRFRHIPRPNKPRPALRVKGWVRTNDGYDRCSAEVPVKLQIRRSGTWVTRKTTLTKATDPNGDGRYNWKMRVRHKHGKYRAIATRVRFNDQDANEIHICRRAVHVRRYRH